VSFDGREVTYGFGELDELVLAYATTIHKSQGSEYPAVVIPLSTQHYTMLARNLLYTGVTRGKRLVVLVGQKKALAIAVRNHGQRQRWSKLREWLEQSREGQGRPGPARHGRYAEHRRAGLIGLAAVAQGSDQAGSSWNPCGLARFDSDCRCKDQARCRVLRHGRKPPLSLPASCNAVRRTMLEAFQSSRPTAASVSILP
jgi:hypothetical protein